MLSLTSLITLILAVSIFFPIVIVEDDNNGSTISGRVLFDNQAPPIGRFKLGLCEDIGTLCAYSIVPPAPYDHPDNDGYFEIPNVQYGRYGLVFDFQYNLAVLGHYPDGGQIVFTVRGTNVDLGTLAYDTEYCKAVPNLYCLE